MAKYVTTRLGFRYPDAVILVFAKAPVAGRVKTRLQTQLSADEAAAIHRQLTHRTLFMLDLARVCPVQLWCSPDTGHDFFKDCRRRYELSLHSQQGDDLGERMRSGIADALKTYRQVIVIGCDCPSLQRHDFENALTALDKGCDVVLAPAEDGGYVLIGLTQEHPALFEGIAWGGDQVLAATREKIVQLKLKCLELPEQWDVDIPDDLHRYLALSE